jgi:hypothetical protein
MATAYLSPLVRCDSGVESPLYKTLEPYEHAVDRSSATSDSTVDRSYYTSNAIKRTLSDAPSGCSEAAEYAAKKGKYDKDNNSKVNNTAQVRRVLCPFFIERPDMDAHRVSCYNKGFNEIARLKQHLVKEHKVSSEFLDYFKDTSFRSLGTLEAKWARMYCTLFPGVRREDVPSPCKCLYKDRLPNFTNKCIDKPAVAFVGPSAPLSACPSTPLSVPEDILALDDCKAVTNTLFDFPQKSKPLARKASGLPTPPSSAEASPELGNLETSPVSASESLFPLPTAREPLSNTRTDPQLFEYPNLASLALSDNPVNPPLFDSPKPSPPSPSTTSVTNAAPSPPTTLAVTAQPIILPTACQRCNSANIRPTWGMAPSIWVCQDCCCTDMNWSLVSNDTSLDLGMPDLVADSPPSVKERRHGDAFMGAEMGLEWDFDEAVLFGKDSIELESNDIDEWVVRGRCGKHFDEEFGSEEDSSEFDKRFTI